MIRLEGVGKIFQEGRTRALQDVSFRMETGEFVFLTGDSGSGKTTLLKLLRREFLPEEGRILVNGVYLDEMKRKKVPEYRRNIGMVEQDIMLVGQKSVYENVLLAREIAGAGRKEAGKRVCAVLSGLGLADKFLQYPRELSQGEKQKVCLARALVNHPGILLADEPTGNLDPSGSDKLIRLLEEVSARGVTVLVATHDLQQIKTRAHRVLKLENGRLL